MRSCHTEFRDVSQVEGSKQVNKASEDLPEVSHKLCLVEPGQKAGRLKFYFPEWRELTSDPQILKTLKGFDVDFVDCPPVQMFPPRKSLLVRKNHRLSVQN